MTFSRAMSLMAMGFMWVGSQIPLYLFGELLFMSRSNFADDNKVLYLRTCKIPSVIPTKTWC